MKTYTTVHRKKKQGVLIHFVPHDTSFKLWAVDTSPGYLWNYGNIRTNVDVRECKETIDRNGSVFASLMCFTDEGSKYKIWLPSEP